MGEACTPQHARATVATQPTPLVHGQRTAWAAPVGRGGAICSSRGQ